MSAYAQSLRGLQQAMLDGAPTEVLPHLATDRPSLDARLNVYIEGYRTRLIAAVLADYPTLAHYLGQTEAEKLAAAYVEATPSTSYTLDHYPLAFATYIAQHSDAVAADVAMVESAIAEVFWLPESEAFVPPASLTPEALMELTLKPRAASRLLALRYPVEDYLRAVRNHGSPEAPQAAPSHVLVLRHDNEVKRHALDAAEYALLRSIRGGISVGAALDAVPETDLAHVTGQLQQWFIRWMVDGFFAK